jgi:hypothetical protein
MTDEKRAELLDELRSNARHRGPEYSVCDRAADELERLAALAQSGAEPVRAFAKAVLHGDDEHKAWLLEAAEAFIAGNPSPAPRGKGTQQPDAEPDAREALRLARPYVAHHDDNKSFPTHTSEVLARIDAALTQSDAEPTAFDKMEKKLLPGLERAAYILQQYWKPGAIVPAFDDIQNEIKRIEANPAALTQSDAEPVAWDKVRRVLEAARIYFKSRDQDPVEMKVLAAIEIILAAPPRSDASAGMIEAAKFTDQMFLLSFERCHFDSYEIMELGERLGLLEQVPYDPKIHDGEIDADEGDMIFVRSAKGKALRARTADRSGE